MVPKKRKREPSLADMAATLTTWTRSPEFRRSLRPGRVNADGVLADPNGTPYVRRRESISPEEARQYIARGALVAIDHCGCGGDFCESEWLPQSRLPAIGWSVIERSANPLDSWIDYWEGESGRIVVFLHGNYEVA